MTLTEYLQKHYSPTSIKGYENMIIRYKKAVGERAETATYADVTNYIGKLRGQNLHPKTLRNNLFCIKIYYRYLIAEGKRKNHPCQHLNLKDKINRSVAVENLYSSKQLEEFYQNYQSKDPKNQVRNKVIISLLIYQALSVLEISQIKKEEINLEEGILKVRANHKSKGRILDLKPKQILLFHSYLTVNRKTYERETNEHFILNKDGKKLWSGGINRLINSGKNKEKFLPIKIRQSVIAHLLKEKNDVRIVQTFAGHRRTGSTEAYQKTGFEELRIAIDLKHPLQ